MLRSLSHSCAPQNTDVDVSCGELEAERAFQKYAPGVAPHSCDWGSSRIVIILYFRTRTLYNVVVASQAHLQRRVCFFPAQREPNLS